jgi:precorrin-2 dehydrogenase / sirohydrochlorin ferrochelatase
MNETIFPVGLMLKDVPVAVIGDTHEAEDKIGRLLEAGARVTLYAHTLTEKGLAALAKEGRIAHVSDLLPLEDIPRFRLIMSTTFDTEYNQALARACRAERVLVSCYDQVQLSDFSMPALVRRGLLRIAIFTGGHSPALAGKIRRSLESILDDRFVAFLDGLGRLRETAKREEPDGSKRRASLIQAVDGFAIEGKVRYPEDT